MTPVDIEYTYVNDKKNWAVIARFEVGDYCYISTIFNHQYSRQQAYAIHIDMIRNFKYFRKYFAGGNKELRNVNFIMRGCKKIDDFETEEELRDYVGIND